MKPWTKCNTVDGSEILHQLICTFKYPIIYHGFYTSTRWLGIGFLPLTVSWDHFFVKGLPFLRCRSYLPSGAQYRGVAVRRLPKNDSEQHHSDELRFDLAFLVTFFNQRKKCGSSGFFLFAFQENIRSFAVIIFTSFWTFCPMWVNVAASFRWKTRDRTRTAQWALPRRAFLKRQISSHPGVGKIRVFPTSKLVCGCFQKWWYPTTMGFPTKNDHFGVFWGYP